MSSIGQNDHEVVSKNSIISEGDSAFEDQTPANNKIKRKEVLIKNQIKNHNGELQANARNANNLTISLGNNNRDFESTEHIKKHYDR